jgi:Cu/Ag efflux pump CusA
VTWNPELIEVKVFGDDPEVLAARPNRSNQARGDPRCRRRRRTASRESGNDVDPVKAGRLGLTVDQVCANARGAGPSRRTCDCSTSIPVRVRYPDAYRFDPAKLGQTPVHGSHGELVPASALAIVSEQTGQEELLRENLRQMALVTARLEDRDLGSAVDEIRTVMQGVKFPVGYTYEVGGQYRRHM